MQPGRPQRYRLATALLMACLVTAGGWGCHGSGGSIRIVCGECEEWDRFVRLQLQPADSPAGTAPQLAHPFVMSPQDWRVILKRIHVQYQPAGFLGLAGKGPVSEAFATDEIEYLAATLSKAFALAGPNEWVVFGLTHPHSSSLTEHTTGGWYRNGATLHLILANYRNVVSLPGIRTMLQEDPMRVNGASVYDLVPGEHQRLVQQDETLGSLLRPKGQELAIDYKAVLLAGTVIQQEPNPSSPKTPSAQTPASLPSLEERLQALKRLRDQGLITEKDYKAKKQQLLDRL